MARMTREVHYRVVVTYDVRPLIAQLEAAIEALRALPDTAEQEVDGDA